MAGTSSSTARAASSAAGVPPDAAYMPASSAADSAPACSRSTSFEVAIARRHRQPVGFPHDRHPDDLHVDVEVGDHLSHQHQLLVVLLAEERPVRPHDLQQLQHDRQHAREMRWPGSTFELLTQWARMDRGAGAVRVHVGCGGSECDLDALGAQRREIVVERPRIGIEILAGAELQRVDENRNHHDGALHPLCGPDQRQMALVQRAHRRHQHHPAAGGPQRPGDVGDVPRAGIDVQLAGSEFGGLRSVMTAPLRTEHREHFRGGVRTLGGTQRVGSICLRQLGFHFGQRVADDRPPRRRHRGQPARSAPPVRAAARSPATPAPAGR